MYIFFSTRNFFIYISEFAASLLIMQDNNIERQYERQTPAGSMDFYVKSLRVSLHGTSLWELQSTCILWCHYLILRESKPRERILLESQEPRTSNWMYFLNQNKIWYVRWKCHWKSIARNANVRLQL